MPGYLLHSVFVYGFVGLVSLLFGTTLLRMLRPGLSRTNCIGLAPLVTAGVWSWLLSLGIRTGHTVNTTSIWVWGLTLLVVVLGLLRKVHRGRARHGLIVVCLLTPLVVMAPAFWHGLEAYTDGFFVDTWLYAAEGRHAWQNHFRDPAHTNLRPVYLICATTWNQLRIVGPALEGFFSRLYVPGEIQMGANLYMAHSLLMLCGALMVLARSLGLRTWGVVLAILLVACSRWVGNIMTCSSLDHLFALPYLGACLALVRPGQRPHWRGAVLLGGFLGTVALAYPEGLAFVLGPVALGWGWRLLRSARAYRLHLVNGGLVLLTMLLFLHVEIGMMVENIRAQFANATTLASRPEARAGGTQFSGMLGASCVPAFLGMGPEWWDPQWSTYLPPDWVARLLRADAWVVSGIALAGLLMLGRRGRPDVVVSAGVLLSGAVYYLWKERYPYAAYKPLTFAWPLVMIGMAQALVAVWRVRPRLWGHVLAGVGLCSVAWCLSPYWVPRTYPPGAVPGHSFREYHVLKTKLAGFTRGQPILLVVDQPWVSCWLEYFLCDEPVYNACPKCWFTWQIPGGVRPQLGETRFLLTDRAQPPATAAGHAWVRIYESASFSLWKLHEWPERAGPHDWSSAVP